MLTQALAFSLWKGLGDGEFDHIMG